MSNQEEDKDMESLVFPDSPQGTKEMIAKLLEAQEKKIRIETNRCQLEQEKIRLEQEKISYQKQLIEKQDKFVKVVARIFQLCSEIKLKLISLDPVVLDTTNSLKVISHVLERLCATLICMNATDNENVCAINEILTSLKDIKYNNPNNITVVGSVKSDKDTNIK